jgi:hypothetical protein
VRKKRESAVAKEVDKEISDELDQTTNRKSQVNGLLSTDDTVNRKSFSSVIPIIKNKGNHHNSS